MDISRKLGKGNNFGFLHITEKDWFNLQEEAMIAVLNLKKHFDSQEKEMPGIFSAEMGNKIPDFLANEFDLPEDKFMVQYLFVRAYRDSGIHTHFDDNHVYIGLHSTSYTRVFDNAESTEAKEIVNKELVPMAWAVAYKNQSHGLYLNSGENYTDLVTIKYRERK